MTNIDEAKARLRGSLMDYGPRAEDDDIAAVLDALDAAERERDEALAVIEQAKAERSGFVWRDGLKDSMRAALRAAAETTKSESGSN